MCQAPAGISNEDWAMAVRDAAEFIATWGKLALQFGWSVNSIFGVPRTDGWGIIWLLKGRTVQSLGPGFC
jgi:hypothetical protein